MYSLHSLSAKETVGTALKGPNRSQWIEAIRLEIFALISGGTLEETPEDAIVGPHRVIHSTLQLKHKRHQDLTTDKFKARLCACGNELWSNTAETYSPTIGALAYATVHQIAIIDRMSTCTVDTVGAYLYADYPTDAIPLFLTLPANVATVLGLDPNQHYKIKKYLYGLPDAGRAYYREYSAHLIANGYERTVSDPCLFVKVTGKSRTYVFTHVDDTFVCSTDPAELVLFQKVLKKKYEITVCNDVSEYLGIRITKHANGDVLLTQPKLLNNLFQEYAHDLESMRHVSAPQRLIHMQTDDTTPMEQTKYLHLLGALIYITKSRPDIATAISFAAVFAAKPTLGAYRELIHCLKYLEDTKHLGLILRAGTADRELKLKCYVDASYLTHSDSKSHTGFCMSFGDMGTFYSKSSKQTLVATSSTHAEMRALYTLIIDIMFVVTLCDELKRPVRLPAIVMEDNQPVIDLTADISSRSKKCKHFLMLVSYVKEQINCGLIELSKVATTANIADLLTKIVVGNEFRKKSLDLLGNHATDDTRDQQIL
jgi:KUP system potassium uptake protein